VITAAALVTATYRVRLAELITRQSRALAALWAMINPDDPVTSLTAIGTSAAPLIAAGQVAAIAESLGYMTGLVAAASGVPVTDVAPFTLIPGIAGFTASGAPVGALTGFTPRLFEQRRAAGHSQQEALTSARALLDSVNVSEPYRAANQTILGNAGTDDRLTGRVNRIPEPDACDFCQLIADRGYVPATAGFAAHAWCRCTASPEIAYHVSGRRSTGYARTLSGRGVMLPRDYYQQRR